MADRMNVGLGIYMDEELERLGNGLGRIDETLKRFFETKDYGKDVESIFIGLILTGPGSEKFHPVRLLRYRKVVNLHIRVTGQRLKHEKVVTFSVKPDYSVLRRSNAEEAGKFISESILMATEQMVTAQKRFPDFDVAKFRRDLELCLLGSNDV